MADQFASWSPYNYVLGNPVLLVDPDGRAPAPPNEYEIRTNEDGTTTTTLTGYKGGNETDYITYVDECGTTCSEEVSVSIEYTSGPVYDHLQHDNPTPGERVLHGKNHTDIDAYMVLADMFMGGGTMTKGADEALGFALKSRKAAMKEAKDFAKVPRNSKGGEDILMNELNPSSRGSVWERMKSYGAKLLGKKNPNGKNKWMEHPDGHPDAGMPGIPDHHSGGHIHATNPSGKSKIIPYKK